MNEFRVQVEVVLRVPDQDTPSEVEDNVKNMLRLALHEVALEVDFRMIAVIPTKEAI